MPCRAPAHATCPSNLLLSNRGRSPSSVPALTAWGTSRDIHEVNFIFHVLRIDNQGSEARGSDSGPSKHIVG